MDNKLFFQILVILIVLLFGAYNFLALFLKSESKHIPSLRLPSFFSKRKEKESGNNKSDIVADSTNEKVKVDDDSTPKRDYSYEANMAAEKERRILEYIEEENKKLEREAPQMPHVPYEEDQSSIALDELYSLRMAIRSVSRELSSLRKTNKEMHEMIKKLHVDHGDALERIKDTSLLEEDRKQWHSDFAREFRKYEDIKKQNPDYPHAIA